MKKIFTAGGRSINILDVKKIHTPTITYIVARTADKLHYLFRTLENTESLSDFIGKVYTTCEQARDSKYLIFIKVDSNYDHLIDLAHRYQYAVSQHYCY